MRDGIYADDLLLAAVAWLDLFTWLDEHAIDFDGLCQGLGLAPRPADVMCTLFRAMGLLEPGPGRLRPTALARDHLVAGARFDLRSYYSSLRERPTCRELLRVLTTGEPASWSSADHGGTWEDELADVGFARRITEAMDARGALLAPALASALIDVPGNRLLDIAGGSGAYATALVDARPDLQATIVERPPVDAAARTLLAERGYADRVRVVVGDMFERLPSDHEIHLLSHVLHDWDEEGVRRILAASFRALPPGGWLVDHDAHINEDKTGPLPIARYSVLLAHATRGKCWSVSELAIFLDDAGFRKVTHREVGPDRTVLLARKL
ncbi:MAG: methyltransferase [Acidimicrobiales bacterium]